MITAAENGVSREQLMREKELYEYDSHHCKQHDCLSLLHRFFTLLNGLVGLNNTGLLLLETNKVVDLLLISYIFPGRPNQDKVLLHSAQCSLRSFSSLPAL